MYHRFHKQSCPRDQASIFSQRVFCKWDGTTQLDGPSSCRVLKPNKIDKGHVMGWQNVGDGQEVAYDQGPDFETDINKVQLEDTQDREIQKDFEKNEAKIKDDYKTEIKHLRKFYQKLDEEFNFDIKKLGPEGLTERLKLLNQAYRDSREKPVAYVKYKGVKFMHILEDLPKAPNSPSSPSRSTSQRKIPIKSTVIEDFKAFSKLANIKKNELQYREKFADDLFYHLQPNYIEQNKAKINHAKSLSPNNKLIAHSKGVSDSFRKRSFEKMKTKSSHTAGPSFQQYKFLGDDLNSPLIKLKRVQGNKMKKSKQSMSIKFMGNYIDNQSNRTLLSRNSSSQQKKSILLDINEEEDKDKIFQLQLNGFVKNQISKINDLSISDRKLNVDTINLEEMVRINQLSLQSERRKLVKSPATPQTRSKLSLQLSRVSRVNKMISEVIECFKFQVTTARAETSNQTKREMKSFNAKFFKRVGSDIMI